MEIISVMMEDESKKKCLSIHPNDIDALVAFFSKFKDIAELTTALSTFKSNYEKDGIECYGEETDHPIIHTAIQFRSYLGRLP